MASVEKHPWAGRPLVHSLADSIGQQALSCVPHACQLCASRTGCQFRTKNDSLPIIRLDHFSAVPAAAHEKSGRGLMQYLPAIDSRVMAICTVAKGRHND
jgi:hypothetical protein